MELVLFDKDKELMRTKEVEVVASWAWLVPTGLYWLAKMKGEKTLEIIPVVVENKAIYQVAPHSANRHDLRKALRYPEPEGTVWVTVYEVTREYGGPEEGGWYYDHWRAIEEYRCTEEKIARTYEEMKEKYEDEPDDEIRVVIETAYREHETRRRPIYQ